jgi:branched-subunit amino acid transport protein AzlD
MNFTHSLITIIIVAVVTILLRFLPFLVFKSKTPKAVIFLGKVLPYSIMGMLVVYCLKGISFINAPHGIPEIIAVLLVVLLHKLWHNTLISIAVPTAVYMLLIQLVF